MKKTILSISILILVACSAKMMTFSHSDIARGSKLFPGLNAAELAEGKSIAEEHCIKCHELKQPIDADESGWRNILPNMCGKVNRKEGRVIIGQKEQDLMLKYYLTMCSAKPSSK